MYVMTHHGTLLARDMRAGVLAQVAAADNAATHDVLQLDFTYISQLKHNDRTEAIVAVGALAGHKYIQAQDPRSFHLLKNEHFACAEPNGDAIVFNRKMADLWETFWLVEHDQEGLFKSKVAQLSHEERPVCLHFGCADRRIPGFLNIDIHPYNPADPRPWRAPVVDATSGDRADYFFFDFAEKAWPIPDCSVDYIYSEDFIEHIPQKFQISFFAEALRVLKPGAINRVSTPCLNETMRRHADFTRGYSGVYFGEYDNWGHVCLFTRGSLQEMAAMVGYRQAFFTARNHGTSRHAVTDTRPADDRDEISGNIIADLIK